MAKLFLVRHGLTDWNQSRRYQGQTDVKLNQLGRDQAARLRDRLAKEPIDTIYSSDLSRTRETAEIIAAGHQKPVELHQELREIAFGHWEGLTYKEVGEHHAEELRQSEIDPLNFAPAGGESLGSLEKRLTFFLTQIGVEQPDRSMLVVTHRGALRVLICSFLGLPPTSYWRIWVDCGSLSIVDCYPEGCILSLLNDTSHLKGLTDAS